MPEVQYSEKWASCQDIELSSKVHQRQCRRECRSRVHVAFCNLFSSHSTPHYRHIESQCRTYDKEEIDFRARGEGTSHLRHWHCARDTTSAGVAPSPSSINIPSSFQHLILSLTLFLSFFLSPSDDGRAIYRLPRKREHFCRDELVRVGWEYRWER